MNNLEEKLKELKTFEDACRIEKLDPKKVVPDFSCYPEKDRTAMEAMSKLVIITRAANRIDNDGKEWIPDWNDTNEWKYEAWFDMSSSGFRYDGYGYWFTFSIVGSRLCFKSRELCEYIGTQFVELYKEFYQ